MIITDLSIEIVLIHSTQLLTSIISGVPAPPKYLPTFTCTPCQHPDQEVSQGKLSKLIRKFFDSRETSTFC